MTAAIRHALDRADLALQEVSRWTTHKPDEPLPEQVRTQVTDAWHAVYRANCEIRKRERALDVTPFESPSFEAVERGFDWIDRWHDRRAERKERRGS